MTGVIVVSCLAMAVVGLVAFELLRELRSHPAQTQALLDAAAAERARLLAEAERERHTLLERIQRPEHEPYPVLDDVVEMKLNRTEEDEIAEDRLARAQLVDERLERYELP